MTRNAAVRTTPFLCTLAILGTMSGCASSRLPPGADVYHGFTLIDPATERRLENAWVVVEGKRLAKVGTGRAPLPVDAARNHDLSGRYVLPGFIDAHAHVSSTGILQVEVHDGVPTLSMKVDDRISEHNGRIALARGVTTLRDPGGSPEASARYDQKVAAGEWLGPEALHAGAVIQPPPFTGETMSYPRTEAEWQAEAAREVRLGMKFFKLYVDLTEAELATGIRVAHQHGLKAIAHLNRISWTRAVELGVDGLEHALPTSPDLLEPAARARYIAQQDMTSRFMYRWFELADFDGPLIRELVEQLARKKVVVNMTLIVNEIVYNTDDLGRVLPASELRYAHPDALAVYEKQLRASAAGWTPEDFQRARAVMPKVLAFARLLHDAGVPMMIGTDGGGGVMLGREMELHRQAGIPAWDVLRMATSGTADILGLGGRIGRFKAGYEADLVILDADPLLDIRAADRVYAVLNNGRLLVSEDLVKSPAAQK